MVPVWGIVVAEVVTVVVDRLEMCVVVLCKGVVTEELEGAVEKGEDELHEETVCGKVVVL